MSLGLPRFGAHPRRVSHPALGVVRALGFAALAYALLIAAVEGRSALLADRALEKSRLEVARAQAEADRLKGSIRKNPDTLIATASVESSPERVFKDLNSVLPSGVSLVGFKVEYLDDASARLDFSVVAATPAAYDRFLANLSASPLFRGIKPGSESRPGLVRATVSAVHRPAGVAR
jgi:hypothetical protein